MSKKQKKYNIPPAHAVLTLQGDSRQIYGFSAFPLAAPIGRAGVGIFVRPPDDPDAYTPSWWTPLYICGARDFGDSDALPRGIADQARGLGATHMLVHFCGRGEDARQAIAEDLIAALRPALNTENQRAAA